MENKLGISVKDPAQKIPGPRVRVGPKQHCSSEPEVRVHKQGDRIESIVIACPCGEEITVICGYDETVSS